MNKHLSLLTAALFFTGASSAVAASSTELTVKGLITPSACTPTLAGNSINLGTISAKDLNPDNPTTIDRRTLPMSVNCDAAITFALHGIDNRAGTALGGGFGLGMVNTKKLGNVYLTITNPMADGVLVQPLASYDKGATWEKEKFWDPGLYMSVGTMGGDLKPITVKDLNFDLAVDTLIAKGKDLDLSSDIRIDGSATLEVLYP